MGVHNQCADRQGRENVVKNNKVELRWGVEQRLEFIEFRLF